MKKILFTLIIAAASTGAFAQDSTRAGKRPVRHEHMKSVQEDLKLSDQQNTKVKEINKNYMAGIQELRKDTQLSKEDRKAKMDILNADRSTQFKNVLSADQYAKWESNRTAMHKKMEGMKDKHDRKMVRGKGKRGGDKMHQELGLNQEQQQQLKTINTEFRDKATALRSNKDLSEDDKKSQFKQLREERDGKLKAALTSEQYEKIHQHGRKKGEKPAAENN